MPQANQLSLFSQFVDTFGIFYLPSDRGINSELKPRKEVSFCSNNSGNSQRK